MKAKETQPSVEQRVAVQQKQANELARALGSIRRSAKTPRDRALGAIGLVIDHFLELAHTTDPPIFDRQLLRPFLEIQEGLIDLDRGVRVPLFEPISRRRGKPVRSLAKMDQQELAALAVDALREAGDTLKVAAKTVAKRLEEIGYKFSSRTEAWRQVVVMRHEVAKNAKTPGTIGRLPFLGAGYGGRKAIRHAVAERGQDARELAKLYLDQLKRTA